MVKKANSVNVTLTQDELEVIKRHRSRQAEKIFEDKVTKLAEAKAGENDEYQKMVTEYNRIGEELDALDEKFKEEARGTLRPASDRPKTTN